MPFVNILGKNIYYQQKDSFLAERMTVVFVHGAGGTHEHWGYQLKGIEGYNLIALDLPGHGRSEGPAFDNIPGYQKFLEKFLQELEFSALILVGHSMGGAIAMELALADSKTLKALIIVDSGARLRVNPRTLDTLSQGKHPLENIKFSFSDKAAPEVLKQAIAEMQAVPTEVYLADFRACDTFNIMDRVKDINFPTLVICGQDDKMTPVKYSEYLDKELAQSTLVFISDAGHSAMIEQPLRVNNAIIDFLTRLGL